MILISRFNRRACIISFYQIRSLLTENVFAPEVLASLRARGQTIQEGSTAKVYGVQLDSEGILSGAYDSRGEGAAGGY